MQQIPTIPASRVALKSLVVIFLTGTCFCAAEENPFQNLLDDFSYQKALGRMTVTLLEAEELAKSKMPTTGARVAKIAPGYQAINLGIRTGSILDELDKQKLWGNVPWNERRSDSQLLLINPEKLRKAFTVAPGIVGLRYVEHYRPELFYIRRETEQGTLWYEHAMVGAMHWEADPKLGETAWHKAIEAGYPQDAYSDYFAALFAQHRPDGAGKELDRFMARFGPTEKIPNVYLPRLTYLLASTGNLKHLKRLSKQEGDNFPWLKTDLSKLNKWSRGKPLPETSLLERAKALHGKRVTEKLKTFAQPMAGVITKPLPDFFTKVPSKISQPSGSGSMKLFFGQELLLNNIHLSADITVECKIRDKEYGSHMTFFFEEQYPNRYQPPQPTKSNPTIDSLITGIPTRTRYPKDQSSHYPTKFRYPQTEPLSFKQVLTFGLVYNVNSDVPALHISGSQTEALLRQRSPHLSMSRAGGADESWDLQHEELSQRRLDEIQELRTMKVDMVRLGNEAGIYLNGVCYYHMPVGSLDNGIAIGYKLSGVDVTFSNFSVWKLRD